MIVTGNYAIDQFLLPAAMLFFLISSLVGAALGAGLLVRSALIFRLFGAMNRYRSTRHGLKPLAVVHDIGKGVERHRRVVGAGLVIGGLVSIYGLLAWFDTATVVATLNLEYPPDLVAWIADSVRWTLILSGAAAVVVGVMLGFFRDALGRLEAYANRWYSVRKLTLGGDSMHLHLDRLVEAFPRAAGTIILLANLLIAADVGLLWLRLR